MELASCALCATVLILLVSCGGGGRGASVQLCRVVADEVMIQQN